MEAIPIPTLHLFPALDSALIALLKSLSAQDWEKPTLAKQWRVKDVAAHLLDGNLRILSILRDGYMGDPPQSIASYKNLVDYLNGLNADWVRACKRLSSKVLIDLLETSGKEYCEYLSTLDPFAPAVFSVGWAGEEQSVNWFHIARDYTEKWHHQQQIREAVNKPGILTPEYFYPCLATFMQALPHTYRNVVAQDGTAIKFVVAGDAGGVWYLKRMDAKWHLLNDIQEYLCEVTINADDVWKLFTKALSAEQVAERVHVKGEYALSKPFLSTIAIMG